MNFRILASRFFELTSAFEKLNKKSEKYNTEKLSFDCVNDPYLEDGTYFQDIIVTGMIPVIGDFKLIGVLEYLDDNTNIVKCIPGENMPEEYRDNDFFCDHCKTSRYRKEVVVVQNNLTKEYVQLGKNCLKDYLGISLEGLVNKFSWLQDAIDNCSNPDFCSGGRITYSCNNRLYLATCLKIVNSIGFVSKGKADNDSCMSTSFITSEVVFGTSIKSINNLINEHSLRDITDGDYSFVDEALDWIANVDDKGNDYLYNLKMISRQDEVMSKHFGFLASLIPAYQRYLSSEAEKKVRAENQKDSEYVGEVKKRMSFDVKCVFIKLVDTMYGTSTVLKFIDKDGNNLVWFGSGAITDYDLNEEYTIKGTVKKHETYNGIKQTQINRVKNESLATA